MKRKNWISIMVICLCLVSCSRQQEQGLGGANTQKELLTLVRHAVQQQDLTALLQLGYWENVPLKTKAGMERHLPDCFDYHEPKFTIREMTAEERAPVKAHSGKTYVWNIEPVAYLVVAGSDPEDGSLSIPFGKHNGRYYIASRLPKD